MTIKLRRNRVYDDIVDAIDEYSYAIDLFGRNQTHLYITEDVFDWLNKALERQGQPIVKSSYVGDMYLLGIPTRIMRGRGFVVKIS